ncbi:hypothetical protein TNCV_4648571 [Trichonephila clavipes]|uniref:Uncharacterized protein n=1 Tax=Trichonephila clavipes TaxID=2585209 RepID=A0A8X6VSF5_TRICX|nr:hypothetical protein TNCV_4648571 [Trichonephila clavipes]
MVLKANDSRTSCPCHDEFRGPRSDYVRQGFVNGILETGGVMDKCVQMWTRNYGALGQTARVCFGVLCANRKKEEVKRDFGDKETGEKRRTSKRRKKSSKKRRADRLRKRRGESQSFCSVMLSRNPKGE